ncbi:hypothetical protein NPX13_g2074 [Xylaria arbuscula]|uniref:ABC transporter domain-containing protein n=1 Tax=Xylaria arbuscula TaxID=114810 RepID=A0A9W8NKW3_9PEZI|nr:hypothetical protein NPX13_g2074 [Xylaria arbuscula]
MSCHEAKQGVAEILCSSHEDENPSPQHASTNPDSAELARSFSHKLMRTITTPEVKLFLQPAPELDPNSKDFNAREWAKTLLHVFAQDPNRYPRQPIGVSWRFLSVHGFGSDTDYQKDVFDVLFRGPLLARERISSRRKKISILNEFDGLVRKGEMLLVLGRPGSGVSTLLKTIAGELKGLHMDSRSQISYQGVPWDIMHSHFRGEVIYQAETDVHFPQLTVGQTLLLAALGRTPKNRLPGVGREEYAQFLRDVVMSVFGISHTVNTKVGNDFIRGVSGGERKRVSIAEATLSQSAIQCWDNSTRGLDSATALEFAKTLRLSAELAETAAIVAMYQASEPAYNTFDKVAVLYEGRQIYFGPIGKAKEYFVGLGFHCPRRQTTADFLTSMTNALERRAKPGFEAQVPRTSEEFETMWKYSSERAQLITEIAEFENGSVKGLEYEQFKASKAARQASLTRSRSPYTISIPMQIQLCMTRGFQRIRGDMTFFVITVAANLVVSLSLGSIFYNLKPTAESINSRAVLLYFAILFNALSSALEIFSLYIQRPIVEKHARYALYHPFAEAIASAICELPSKVASAIAFNVPLYFLANLRRDPGHFFIFLLFGFTCTLTMSFILRTIGQTSRTVQQALTPVALFILGLVIYTGFVLPTKRMQHWLRWINYIDPIAYAYESLLANELSGRQFSCSQFIPMGEPYDKVLLSQKACSTPGALPGQYFIDGDFYLKSFYEYSHAHLWRNFGILIGFVVFFASIYLLAAEYLSIGTGKGEVLVFRRGHDPKLRASANISDEESGKSSSHQSRADETTRNENTNAESSNIIKSNSIFHWRNVNYDISIKGETKRILNQVDGWVKPGTLTALMGATGAGKTTLLDVLADRVTVGVVAGDILVNGEQRQRAFQRQTGYVQQQDIHLETSTVREALQFSAVLRQPAKTSKKEKYEYVEYVIQLLGMESYAEAVVGVPGEGLNTEQRKRLTIGVELVAKPDLLLFLDEPTSGLDSQTAWSIATLIRKLCNEGQAILCTIHQPSGILFEQFDRLLLLSFGGKTVYFGNIGKDSRTLIDYFEGHGAASCAPMENPAEWMLKVIGAAPGSRADVDWAQVWRGSQEYKEVQIELDRLNHRRPPSRLDPSKAAEGLALAYAAPFHMQLLACTKRVFQQYWRTPSYIYSKFILCLGMSLLIGLSFYQAKVTIFGIQSQEFATFLLVVIFAFLVYQALPHFIVQRQLYEGRERASRMYSWYTFITSSIIVELPWGIFASLLIFFPYYYLVGMDKNAIRSHTETERGGLMYFILLTFLLFQSTFANMCIAGVETAELGGILSLLLFALSLIFCGVIVPRASLPGFWIFLYRVSPFTYIVGAMLSTGLGRQEVQCDELELLTFQPPQGQTCGEYLAHFPIGALYNKNATSNCQFCPLATTDDFLASVDIFYDQRWRNLGLLFAYVAFNVVATFFLYWIARVPKKTSWKFKTNPLKRKET